MGFEPQGAAVQVAALAAALLGALLLTWTDKRWPEVQEAVIGVDVRLAATAGILLLATNPHGGEHLKDLLVGQILWVDAARLVVVAVLYALILAVWFGWRERLGRHRLLRAVRVRGHRVGAARGRVPRVREPDRARARDAGNGARRLAACYALGALGYAAGLGLSLVSDLPPGPLIVCTLTGLGLALFLLKSRAPAAT